MQQRPRKIFLSIAFWKFIVYTKTVKITYAHQEWRREGPYETTATMDYPTVLSPAIVYCKMGELKD